MAEDIPQLKRKREGVGAERKRSKKQRHSAGSAEKNVDIEVEGNVTEKSGTRSRKNRTSRPKDPSDVKSRIPMVNGDGEQPSTDFKRNKRNGEQQITQNVKENGNSVEDQKDSVAPLNEQDSLSRMQKRRRKTGKALTRHGKNQQPVSLGVVDTAAATTTASQFVLSTQKEKKSRARSKWLISSPHGGWFLAVDPIFSPDEKYLIIANSRTLQVYATETSLLVNSLPVGGSAVLTAYALSSSKPNQVYIADSGGLISLWDWMDRRKIGRWDVGATVRNMQVITQPETEEDLVYCHERCNGDTINVHALRTKEQSSKTELKRILKTGRSVSGFKVISHGKYIVIAGLQSITVGIRTNIKKTALQEFEYYWRELTFTRRITAFDVYLREADIPVTNKKSAKEESDTIDIAIGDESGSILLFENILMSFAGLENIRSNRSNVDNAEALRPKRFHWHREAVGSVKWSLDGNYLISGGDETVLTIWQLATGKPQHLPHLTAAIEHIVVSPSGSSYAVSLANNSVIVLSTSELEAKTNIIGIQTRRVDLQLRPHNLNVDTVAAKIRYQVPMAVDPIHASRVFMAVPSSQPRRQVENYQPEPYLQTFDLTSRHAIARQALTRNNATDPNMAPEGGRILEPDTNFLQISNDGKWLATVDVWLPPPADLAFVNEGVDQLDGDERLHRREVYLKFWQRDEQKGQWKLDARVDAPHFFDNVCGAGEVLDLVADPTTPGFATIGEDHAVRIWRPKTRLRDGIVVRGADRQGLVTWSVDRVVTVSDKIDFAETNAGPSLSTIRTARLAFSNDGSVVIAGVSWAAGSDSGAIHLIDTNTAKIRRSMTEIGVSALSGLSLIGRHLIVVADIITVWDLVSDQLVYTVPIKTPGINQLDSKPLVRLASNEEDGTFAVSLPQFEKADNSKTPHEKISSRISVYNTQTTAPLWSHTVPGITLGLAAKKGERGYVALDSASCLRTISPNTSIVQLPTPPPEDSTVPKSILPEVAAELPEDTQTLEIRTGKVLAIEGTDDREVEKVVITQDKVQALFDTGAALPTPQGVFGVVLSLFGGKKS